MVPVSYKIPHTISESVRIEYWEMPRFYQRYHYHSECQLTYIISSKGVLFSSGVTHSFKAGDLFLLGSNLPHVFLSESSTKEHSVNNDPSRAITIFFNSDQFTDALKDFPEAHLMIKLFEDSKYGITSELKSDSQILKWIRSMRDATGFDRVISLLKALSLFVKMDHLVFISPQYVPVKDPLDSKKLKLIFNHIEQNYQQRIHLEEVADLINMTPSAFCRFFKKRTQKTFSDYLIETRITKACKLLTQDDYTVSESCFESGYNSTSNFHRHFRRLTGLSPKEYKRKILSNY